VIRRPSTAFDTQHLAGVEEYFAEDESADTQYARDASAERRDVEMTDETSSYREEGSSGA